MVMSFHCNTIDKHIANRSLSDCEPVPSFIICVAERYSLAIEVVPFDQVKAHPINRESHLSHRPLY